MTAVRLRVLLVEDHSLVRSAIRGALSADDVEIVGETSNAEAATQLVSQLRPDVVLVDLDLPGRSGSDLIRTLSPTFPATAFVVLSATDREPDVLDALRSGASGYLSKDTPPEALLRAVRGIARGEAAISRRDTRLLIGFVRRAAPPGPGSLPGLTERENEVLALLAAGLTDREIAEALVISRRTVESHVANILHKLGVASRVQAARIFRQHA